MPMQSRVCTEYQRITVVLVGEQVNMFAVYGKNLNSVAMA